MKRVILCIEDDIYKTACMKNCAEAGFHLEVRIQETSTEVDLLETVITSEADEILYLPNEGVEAFLARLKADRATRLNTEVRIVLCQQFESTVSKVVRDTVTEFAAMSKTARARVRKAHARARTVPGAPGSREADANASGAGACGSAAGNPRIRERGHLLEKRHRVLQEPARNRRAAALA